jgi:hypothetical protein
MKKSNRGRGRDRLSGIGPLNGIRQNLGTSNEGREQEKHRDRENLGTIVFTASYSVKRNLCHRSCHWARNRLQ